MADLCTWCRGTLDHLDLGTIHAACARDAMAEVGGEDEGFERFEVPDEDTDFDGDDDGERAA